MSSDNTENKQSPQELTDETLKSVAGGKGSLTDPNPPAENPSPSESSLDPSSAKQPSQY